MKNEKSYASPKTGSVSIVDRKNALNRESFQNLTDAELLTLLLKGTPQSETTVLEIRNQLLNNSEGNISVLSRADFSTLKDDYILSNVNATRILACFELAKRKRLAEKTVPQKITAAYDVYAAMHIHLYGKLIECFYIILLNRANRIVSIEKISEGGVSGTVADAKVIFKKALSKLCSGIVLVHNHPSGNKNPSKEDIQLTKKLKEGANFLDLKILDHVIYTDQGFFSFVEEGLI